MRFLVIANMGNPLVMASLQPLIELKEVSQVIFIRNNPGPALPKVRYFCLPYLATVFLPIKLLMRFLWLIGLTVLFDPQVIMVYHWLPDGPLAFICAKIFRKIIIVNLIGGPPEVIWGGLIISESRLIGKKVFEKINLLLLKHCEIITVTGSRSRNYFINQGFAAKRLIILPSPPDHRNYSPEAKVEKKYDILLIAYYLTGVKRVDRFLEIIAEIKTRLPGIKAAVVGIGGLMDKLQYQAKALAIQDAVAFLGRQKDIKPVLQQAKIFVLTSATEGLSYAMFEAVASGLPVVVPDVGDLTDLAKDGFNARVIETHRIPHRQIISNFSDAIIRLLTDDKLREQFSINARAAIHEGFTHASIQNKWRMIFKQLGLK